MRMVLIVFALVGCEPRSIPASERIVASSKLSERTDVQSEACSAPGFCYRLVSICGRGFKWRPDCKRGTRTVTITTTTARLKFADGHIEHRPEEDRKSGECRSL